MDGDYVVAALLEEEERKYRERVRLRNLRDASNPFDQAEAKFKKLFRLTNNSALHLCELLNSHLEQQEGFLPKHLKVLAALHFYAAGSYQAPIGEDSLISMSQPSICRAINEVTNGIVSILAPTHIQFPQSPEEKLKTKTKFQELYNFPDVLGAVDGTHFPIHKPPNNNPLAPGNLFYNRKGFYSINCQVVVNAKGKIISLNPNFPGSTHDSAVWRMSDLSGHLERDFLRGHENQWLIGDKGYQLLPWLMTPLSEPESEAAQNYNLCHARARNVVERTFGRLKNKLRCLHKHRTLHYEPEKAAKIIVSCCTIYNMFGEAFSDSDDDDEDADDNLDDSDNLFDDEDRDTSAQTYLSIARRKQQILLHYFE